MRFDLPPLPFDRDALAPHISGETLDFHHGKHHRKYVDTLNGLVQATEWQGRQLEDLVREAEGAVFNNAAQVLNHTFFWSCLSPTGGGAPGSAVADALSGVFGSVERFKEEFTASALGQFGSGWAWLVKGRDGRLRVEATLNAGTPVRAGDTPVLTCDVWEHAYYIDYRNSRGDFLDAFFKLVNWDFVAGNLV
jgi:Fe-Mn family superoxide dismutase